MAEALQLFNRNGRVQTIVTRTGDVVSHQGVLIGGSREQLSGILSKKQELKQLAALSDALDRQLADAHVRRQELEENVRRLETDLQKAIAERNDAAQDALSEEKTLYRMGEDLKNARRHLEITRLEQEQVLGEESDLDEELGKVNRTLEKIGAEVKQVQDRSAQTTHRIGEVAAQLESRNQKVVDLKLELTSVQAKLESGANTLQRLQAFERDSQLRLDRLQRDIEQKKEKRTAVTARSADHENSLRHMYATFRRLEEAMAGNETEYSAIDAAIQKSDEQQAAIQSEREKTLEKLRFIELDLSEKRIKRDNVAGRVQERYRTTINHLRAQQADFQMTVEDMENELERLRTKITAIGDVNLGAIREYETLKERFDFLTAQRDDLVKAIDDLHKVIRKINRITQQRFMETFEQVNAKLMEVFPKLFEGGTARLELTEPEKPLETGVEFMVHPPGKRLTRMSLLSGGEKALSAIAFTFAIFLMRPTSFCLLDEIDAPLDDSNVIRFNNLMQVVGEKSQIIMITHNKKTMEFAETLFGITMEQKGISKVVSVNLQSQAA